MHGRFEKGILFTNATGHRDISSYMRNVQVIDSLQFPIENEFWINFSKDDYFKERIKEVIPEKIDISDEMKIFKSLDLVKDISIEMTHKLGLVRMIKDTIKPGKKILIMCYDKSLLWRILLSLSEFYPLLFGVNDKKISMYTCVVSDKMKTLFQFLEQRSQTVLLSTYKYSPMIRAACMMNESKFDKIFFTDYNSVCKSTKIADLDIIHKRDYVTKQSIKIDYKFDYQVHISMPTYPICHYKKIIAKDPVGVIKRTNVQKIIILSQSIETCAKFYNSLGKIPDRKKFMVVKENFQETSEAYKDISFNHKEKIIIIGKNLLFVECDFSEYDMIVVLDKSTYMEKLIADMSYPNAKSKILVFKSN